MDKRHYKLWSDKRGIFIDENKNLAEIRKASLDHTHRSRITLLEEQRDKNSNDKIIRMKESEIFFCRG